MKKKLLIPLCTIAGIIVIGGTIFGISTYNANKTVVDVIPVSNISAYYYSYGNVTDGLVTSSVSQEIYLMQNQLVKEVYVQEGDQVAIGDKLMEYDTTLTELDLESKKIALNKINLQIKDLKSDISDLKNGIVPGDSFIGLGQATLDHTLTATSLDDSNLTTDDTSDITGGATNTGGTDTSGSAGGSGNTNESGNTDESDNTGESDNINESDNIGESDNINESDNIGESDNINESDNIGESDNTDESDNIDESDNADESDSNDESDEEIEPDTDNILDWNTPIKTEGSNLTVECSSNWLVTPGFILKLMGYDETGEVHDETKALTIILKINDIETQDLFKIRIKGYKLAPPAAEYSDTTVDDFITNGFEFNPPVSTGDENLGFDDGFAGPIYTQEEINQMIKEKQQELASLELSIKQTDLDIAKLEKTLKQSTVTSTVNGVVKTAGDPEAGVPTGDPFMVVDSAEGLYLTGSITELQLNEVTEGSIVSVMSRNSGMTFEAEITEISPYPSSDGYSYGSNPNVSYYPFKAYIADPTGLSNYEYVEITLTGSSPSYNGDMDTLYLFDAYILEEDGKSYVFVRDENEKLKKQEVVTGKKIYGQYSEIVSGLTMMDYVAFPYEKGVKNGAKTQEATDIYY